MPVINFSGIASGIDSNALIQALTDATRKQRIEPKEKKVDQLTETNTGLTDLSSKYGALKTLLSEFTTLGGGALVKSAGSSDETVLSASATGLASNGVYTVTVAQLAKNATGSFNDRFASDTTIVNSSINNGAAAANRTLTVSIGTGAELETVSIELTNTTTWAEVAASFNTQSSKAEASLVNVGTTASPSYALVVTTNNEGISKGNLSFSAGSEITTAGVGAMVSNNVNQATNSQFTISGITGTITRDTNKITNVIPDVTFNLSKVGSATVTIADDIASTSAKVQEFVDSYNEIVTYINESNLIQREENGSDVENIFGPLARTRVDDSSLGTLREVIASTAYTSGTAVRILADLGIETQRDGTLLFKTDTFEEAMSEESSSVNQILTTFSETMASTNGTIDQFIRFNGLFDLTINANKQSITNLNDQIAQAEAQIAQEEQSQRARFARLEALIGRLNQQSSALNSALAGLQG